MRAVISTIVIAGAALLGACTSNESTNVTNTTEVPVENVTTTDTMVTNIDAAAPMDNSAGMMEDNAMGAEAGNMSGNAM